jgi:PAS domain S-box-containing protein
MTQEQDRQHDPVRLAALESLGLMDSAPEEAFDRLTELAAKILGVPVAMVSLIDGQRHFVKSAVGLGEPAATKREIPLTHSFCLHVVNSGEPLIVDDAPNNALVKNNPAISELGVMAYAGMPLTLSDGQTLGSFCVVDTVIKHWTQQEIDILRELAKSVMTEIELRRELQRRQQIEQELGMLSGVVNNTSDFVGVADLNGKGLFVNQAGLAMTGYEVFSPDMAIASFHPPDVMIRLLAEAIPAALRGETWRAESKLLHRDGHTIPVSQVFLPILDGGGKVTAVASIMRDISEEKAAQIELRLDRSAMQAATVGISISDMTQPDQPLIYINPAFERITGYQPGDVIGKNCRFLQSDDRDQAALDEIRAALKEGRSCNVILRNYRKDGTLFWNELIMAPIFDSAGKVTHFVGIQEDVTKRIETEKRIQEQNESLVKANRELAVARRKADDATRLKSEFLATMSHELRTPLNAIIGYTDIQLAGMTGPLNEEQRDYQERVLRNSEGLLRLINDVLDLAKIEAGRMELLKKPIKLASFLDDVKRQTESLAKDKQIEYTTVLDPRLPEEVIGDPDRLRQILLNLISNAIKFTETGGVTVEITCQGRDSWALVVTDTGIGIPSTAQEYIFDEFRQVDGTSERKHGGTGLGLAIVRNLALMMGGNVRLKSQSGEGSTFTVLLPLVTEAEVVEVEVLAGAD